MRSGLRGGGCDGWKTWQGLEVESRLDLEEELTTSCHQPYIHHFLPTHCALRQQDLGRISYVTLYPFVSIPILLRASYSFICLCRRHSTAYGSFHVYQHATFCIVG